MEGEVEKKKALPPKITTPRRGPLLLVSPKAAPTQRSVKDKRHYVRLKGRPLSRQGYLTRYPVDKLPPRPMDMIDGHLQERGLTWSELEHSLQMVQDLGTQRASESDESAVLKHRMKYTPFCRYGNDPLLSIERYTHSMSSGVTVGPGKIDVSITHSRKEQRQLPSLLSQHPHLATLPSLLRLNRSNNVLSNSDKVKGDLHEANEEEPPPNSRTSSSAAVYETIVGLKSDEEERAKSVAHREARANHSVRVFVSNQGGASIAPAGVRAVVTHRLRPITSNTMVKGKRIVTPTR